MSNLLTIIGNTFAFFGLLGIVVLILNPDLFAEFSFHGLLIMIGLLGVGITLTSAVRKTKRNTS